METIIVDPSSGSQEKIVTRTTRLENVDLDDNRECGGILSCTVGFLGEVIALPFRAVGALVVLVF